MLFRSPISNSLTERCSSVNPEITAVSPAFIEATDFDVDATLFRLSLNIIRIIGLWDFRIEEPESLKMSTSKKKRRVTKLKKDKTVLSKQDSLSRKLSYESNPDFDFGGIPERNLKKSLGC